MDAKKIAMMLGIAVLLPLFVGLFIDAVYSEPKYETYCNSSKYAQPIREPANCSYDYYNTPEYNSCINQGGNPVFNYSAGCPVLESCDMCSKEFNGSQQVYNRNVFFILAPLGLLIVILGIYFIVDYIGAGLIFGGLITMFYATVRYFSDLSKVIRALVVLVELVVIIWIAYKKIGDGKKESKPVKRRK